MSSELNPNHPVTRQVHDHWHNLCAVLIWKCGVDRIHITEQDLKGFAASGVAAVTIQERDKILTLTMVDEAEALRLARQEGGLPV